MPAFKFKQIVLVIERGRKARAYATRLSPYAPPATSGCRWLTKGGDDPEIQFVNAGRARLDFLHGLVEILRIRRDDNPTALWVFQISESLIVDETWCRDASSVCT